LQLRNRLLHYRFCYRFETKPNPDTALVGVEPRVNQIALPLLSLVDDADLRKQIGELLARNQAERLEQRQSTTEARVVVVLAARTAMAGGFPVTIGAVTAAFNERFAAEYGKPVSDRWIGHILRKSLRISAHRSNGVYVVPPSEIPKINTLSARYSGKGSLPNG